MAQRGSSYPPQAINFCSCVGGIVFVTCSSCGSNPRARVSCGACGGAGTIGVACPQCNSHSSSGRAAIPAMAPTYGGKPGYGNNDNNLQGQGQKGYGSTVGR